MVPLVGLGFQHKIDPFSQKCLCYVRLSVFDAESAKAFELEFPGKATCSPCRGQFKA